MRSKMKPSAVTLLGLLVGASACEGKYRPYSPLQAPDASRPLTADAATSLTPEATRAALTPDTRVSTELIGDGAPLPQQPVNPSIPGSNTTTPSDAIGDTADAGAATPMGGTNPNDQSCCPDDCGNTGQQCDPQSGGGQTPPLVAGAACDAAGDVTCGSGLACKACNGGGNECTPVAQCCGGCPGNQTCNGGTCGCTAQQIDCGEGLCIPNAANVCCPATPACGNARPFCDSR